MLFSLSPDTIRRCWELAQGRCECQRDGHDHAGRCNKPLNEHHHGVLGDNGWFTTPWDHAGDDAPDNCEALCWSRYEQSRRQESAAA
jgi:hypothetical protein